MVAACQRSSLTGYFEHCQPHFAYLLFGPSRASRHDDVGHWRQRRFLDGEARTANTCTLHRCLWEKCLIQFGPCPSRSAWWWQSFVASRLSQVCWWKQPWDGRVWGLSIHPTFQTWWLLVDDSRGWPFGCWVTQSSRRTADSTYAVKVWSFHRDHVQCRWRVDLSQAHPPAFGIWAHGGEDPWKTFGSTLQVVATLKALAEQEVTWTFWDWNSWQVRGAERSWWVSLPFMRGDFALSFTWPSTMSVRDWIPFDVFFKANTENDDCAEALGGISGWSCRPTCLSQMEGNPLWTTQRLWVWGTSAGSVQWCRLGIRPWHSTLSVRSCHFLWRLPCLLLQSNTEDCATFQRRVRNVCSRQRRDGCNPHQSHHFMGASVNSSHVFVHWLISRTWNPIKTWSWSFASSQLSSPLASKLGWWKTVDG